MFHAIFMGKVKDYDKWLSTFAEDGPLQKASGGESARALQRLDDPNMGIVITTWKNLEDAKKFVESDELKASMQRGGTVGKPEIIFAEEKLLI